jgi:hypothetical protein
MKKTITEEFTITVSGGSGTATTSDFKPMEHSGGKIKKIVIVPTRTDDKYSFYLENPSSRRIYNAKNKEGTYIDDREITFAKGTHTLGMELESSNGSYTVSLTVELNW